jgi:hypothetical protein
VFIKLNIWTFIFQNFVFSLSSYFELCINIGDSNKKKKNHGFLRKMSCRTSLYLTITTTTNQLIQIFSLTFQSYYCNGECIFTLYVY